MGVMMFLKYLHKLDKEGVLTKELAAGKLTVENLKKAKVFPFRLYIAYVNIANLEVKNLLADVLNSYTDDYRWQAFDQYSWCVGPDVSGSMTSSVNGSALTPATVAGMFSGFFYRGLKNSILLPWADGVQEQLVGPKSDSVVTHCDRIARAGGGGTDLSSVPRYLLHKKIKVDKVYLITDSEHWINVRQGFPECWAKYRAFNPGSQAILHRVDCHDTQPFSPEDAKKLNILQVFGWSDNVIKYLQFKLEGE
jgi:60 kDa SS-A/Ro ribonucleoprotein